MRNKLITLYRWQPERRLSVEDAQAALPHCDAAAVQRCV
jgi:hypothetical protein